MRSGPGAADEAIDREMPDQRLTLILSFFRLYRTTIPDAGILQTLVEAVRQAEGQEGGGAAGSATELSAQRVALCARTVRCFLLTHSR